MKLQTGNGFERSFYSNGGLMGVLYLKKFVFGIAASCIGIAITAFGFGIGEKGGGNGLYLSQQ